MKQTWFQWAGPPQNLAHDQGGEFMTDEWKLMLQENNIRPILSVAPWQRGRIERHGGIVKEMLNRIDNEQTIQDLAQFDEALQQCFHAKNTMSIVNGYSPEQAVLGRASKLPASIVEDEDLSAHISCHGSDIASDRFRKRLELRSAARAAFSRADNSDAGFGTSIQRNKPTLGLWPTVHVLGPTQVTQYVGKRAMERTCSSCQPRVKNNSLDNSYESTT